MERLKSYRVVNTLRLAYKSNHLIMCTEIISICFYIHTEQIHMLCVQNEEFYHVKHGAFKGLKRTCALNFTFTDIT